MSDLRPQNDSDEGYHQLLDYLNREISSEKIDESIQVFEKELVALLHAKLHAISVLKDLLFIAAFLEWVNSRKHRSGLINYAKVLVEKKIIPYKKPMGDFLLVQDIQFHDLLNVVEDIRCRKDLDLFFKESLVDVFLDFTEWLHQIFSEVSDFFSEIPKNRFKIEDPDRVKTQGRILKLDEFIRFLSHLDKRSQLVAKLLYFGGSRTLDEVINLQIDQVFFDEKLIAFAEFPIEYPRHVFEDILIMVEGRKSGNVFTGRQNTPLNPATIFRNFKEAAQRASLDESFSPKLLTANK